MTTSVSRALKASRSGEPGGMTINEVFTFLVNEGGEDALRRTGELLETTIGLVSELPVPALVERIFNRFGLRRQVQ